MSSQIDHLLNETRRFAPSAEFSAQAVAQHDLYERAAADREGFWADQARELHWHKPFTRCSTGPLPFAEWFADGELNVAYNCLDRHVEAGNGDRIALRWEGEPGDQRNVTYAELTDEVKRLANVLTELGIERGDRVALYPPDDPRGDRLHAGGRTHRRRAFRRVRRVLGRQPARAHRRRRRQAGHHRRRRLAEGQGLAFEAAVDQALADRNGSGEQETVEHVLVVKRGGNEVDWADGRDLWWHDVVPKASADHEAEAFPAETPLFILYTSGTTGKPKGILHTSGGYLTQAAFTNRVVHDVHPETDVYWCTADIGWITGHTYVTYGPLANGATQQLYEGTPDTPHPGRWWELIEKHGVTIFYTAPTAIRSFMKIGRDVPQKFDLSSLRLLGSVGEPINPEAWIWYREIIGADKAPIVDTWWQTETGAMMISALPGVTETKPGSAQVPIPASRSPSSTSRANRSATAAADSSWSRNPGRACCAASGATPTATARPTGTSSPTRATTSPATARASTTTETSGCSAASTTS